MQREERVGRRVGRRRGSRGSGSSASASDSGMLVGEGGALAWDGSKPFPFARGAGGEAEEEGEEEGTGKGLRSPEASAKGYAKKAAARFG